VVEIACPERFLVFLDGADIFDSFLLGAMDCETCAGIDLIPARAPKIIARATNNAPLCHASQGLNSFSGGGVRGKKPTPCLTARGIGDPSKGIDHYLL